MAIHIWVKEPLSMQEGLALTQTQRQWGLHGHYSLIPRTVRKNWRKGMVSTVRACVIYMYLQNTEMTKYHLEFLECWEVYC